MTPAEEAGRLVTGAILYFGPALLLIRWLSDRMRALDTSRPCPEVKRPASYSRADEAENHPEV